MYKFVFFFLIFAFPVIIFGQYKAKLKNDTIIWKKDYKLSKADFKGRYRLEKNVKAQIASSICIYFTEINTDLKVKVEAVFLKSKSAIYADSKYTLKHEQIHFDITELYARKLRQAIYNTDFTKVKDIRETISKLYKKTLKDWNIEQTKFDKDVENGMNPAKQEIWLNNIQKNLNDFDDFSSPIVNIKK